MSFGGTAATSVAVVNGTTITASTPAHAAGAVNVVVTNTDTKNGTLTNGYTYTAPAGTIALSTVVSGLSSPVGMERPPGTTGFSSLNSAAPFASSKRRPAARKFSGPAEHRQLRRTGTRPVGYRLPSQLRHQPQVLRELHAWTRAIGRRIISEFQTMASDPNTADPNSERVLLVVNQPFPNHKGGQLVFGPDGFLYIGLGDGGSGGDPMGNGQNTVHVPGENAPHRR